jgi:hypothetical protein
MQLPNTMNTLCDVLNKLEQRGLGNDFKWTTGGFTLDGTKIYSPEELCIIKVYRFEELKDPADLCILYGVQTSDDKIGYILDTYGVYSNYDGDFDNTVRIIPESKLHEQSLFTL